MAWRNLFGNRDQKVTDSEQVAIDSIARELERSETPTGAISTLSAKVRKMINTVASRIRSVVGGSSDVAKAAVLAAAAGATQMSAHAGQDFQPNQNLGSNMQTTKKIDRDGGSPLILTGGVVQDGDKVGPSLQVRVESPDHASALGGSLRYTDGHAQLSGNGARTLLNGTVTVGGGILLDRRDAQDIFGSNVGNGPLQGVQGTFRSAYTPGDGRTSLDLGASYKKTLDAILGNNTTLTSSQTTVDTGTSINTIQTDTTTTTQTRFDGKSVSDISLGGTQHWDNDHQAFSFSTKYRHTTGEPSELGSNLRYQIIGNGFGGEEGRNRFSAQLSANDLGMKNPTYGINVSHAVGPHGSIGLTAGKTEGSDPFFGATYSYSFDGKRASNFSLPTTTQQTAGNMVADMNNEGQNPNIFPYRQLGNLHNTTTVTQVSKVVSSVAKTLITPSASSISLKAGETKEIEISVQGGVQPFVTTDGGVIAELIPVATAQPSEVAVGVMMTSAQDIGAKKFIVRITAPIDASRTNATVTVSAGNTKVDIPTKITGIINQAPVANSDSATTDSNTPVEITVLKNDKDPEGQPLSIVSVTVSPDEGSVLVTANNTLSFTPKPGFVGTAVISYTAKDSQGALSNPTFVSVKVSAVVDPNAFTVAVSQQEVTLEPNSEASIGLITNARILSVTPLKLPSGIMVNFTPDSTPSAFASMNRMAVTTMVKSVIAETPDQSIQVMTGDDVTSGIHTIRMTIVSENGDSKIVTMNVVVPEKQDTATVNLAPTATIGADKTSVSVTNNISDDDGMSNVVYILVDSQGRQYVQSNGDFSGVVPGVATVHTEALVVNAKTGNSELVVSPSATVTIEEPPKTDTVTEYSPRSVTVNGTTVTIENPSAYATDADGKTSVTVYLSKGGYRLALTPASGDAIFDLEKMGVAPKDLSGSWTVEVEPTVPNGATGQTQIGEIQRSNVEVQYDPALVVPADSAFANLGDVLATDQGGAYDIGVLTGPDVGTMQIRTGGVIDQLGRSIVFSASGLPVGLNIDVNTGVISGKYDAGVDISGFDKFIVTIQVSVVGSAQFLSKTFVLTVRDDG